MTRRALITGVTGQDGGYLAEQLLADGVEVHGLVRHGEASPPHLADCVLHEVDVLAGDVLGGDVLGGDVLAGDELAAAVTAVAPSEIYNLVGLTSVALSWEEPVLTAELNGVVVARLLDACWALPSPVRVVQASSAEVFAGAGSAPQDESTPLSPRSPYGASKAFAHHLVQVFRGRGMHCSNAILYNHESPRRPTTFVTRKITSTVAAISRGEATELVLGNLDARRDWGWAPEYVDALVRIARHDVAGDWVIGTGVARTVAEFVEAAFARVDISDWRAYVRVDPKFVRPVDAVELAGNASKAREVLGWAPQVDFAELVGRMVDADLA